MNPKILFHQEANPEKSVFSIVIPSWNNLPYLKCCINSIRKNSTYRHQIIVHVNEGTDGTLEWIQEQKLSYTHSSQNVGVCYGFNAPAALAQTDYIVLSDDDFYFAPDWDKYLFEEIKALGHEFFCITGTMIEHTQSTQRCILSPFDYGRTVETFQEEKFLHDFHSHPLDDWTGGNWYPLVLHRNVWNLIGGLSIEFSPGMASDPDMMMKLWQCGVRYYKGVSRSRVYHFGSKTTRRIKKNNGNRQFLMKWGISVSTLAKHYLHMGEKFTGPLPEPDLKQFRTRLLRDRVKRLFLK